jgi:micrococcal nuclease
MAELIEGQTVVCDLTGERPRGRRVGYCYQDGRDLGSAITAAGLARDCPRYSEGRYAGVERPKARGLPYLSYCRPRR